MAWFFREPARKRILPSGPVRADLPPGRDTLVETLARKRFFDQGSVLWPGRKQVYAWCGEAVALFISPLERQSLGRGT